MRRDMELVRDVLMAVEESDGPVPLSGLVTELWGLDAVGWHVEMLEAHGLVRATVHRGGSGHVLAGEVSSLTWDGCDYLDAIRSDTVWAKARKAIAEAVGDAPLSVVKDVCVALATSLAKARLGI